MPFYPSADLKGSDLRPVCFYIPVMEIQVIRDLPDSHWLLGNLQELNNSRMKCHTYKIPVFFLPTQ